MLLLLALTSKAQTEVITLDWCINTAINTNPDLQAQYYNIEIAEQTIIETKGGLQPTITGTSTTSAFSGFDFAKNTLTTQLGIDGNYTLYQGGRIKNSIKMSQANFRTTTHQYQAKKLNLKLKVNLSYYEILKNRYVVELTENDLKRDSLRYIEIKARYDEGLVKYSDVLQAEVQQNNTKLSLQQVQNVLTISIHQLSQIIATPLSEKAQFEDQLTQTPVMNIEIASADSTMPTIEIQTINTQIEAQKMQIKIEAGSKLPSLFANASYGYGNTQFQDFGDIWNIGFSLNIPIYNGNKNNARTALQQAKLQKLEFNKKSIHQDVKWSVDNAQLQRKNALSKVEITTKTITSSEENLAVTEGEYKEGVSTFNQLIDAQTLYRQAQLNYIQALADYKMSNARLQRILETI
ncbi:MAG: TolC family protein [Flavobacteriales bacterium]|nr:TolC family protein [Flavobacteriales bacterium]